jgi:hypothetical protein
MLQSRFQIATIDVSKEYSLVVTDKQRSLVTFSPDDLTDQLRRLAMLLSYCDKNSKELQSANLMAERNIPVVFNEPAVAVASPSPQPAVAQPTRSDQPTSSPQPQAQPIVRRALPVTRSAHKAEKADKSPSPNKNTHKKTKSSQMKPFNG